LEHLEKELFLKKKLGVSEIDISLTYNNIGNVYFTLGQYNKALDFFKNCLRVRQKILGEDHIYTANSYVNIGTVFYTLDDYDKGLEYCLKSLEINKRLVSTSSAKVADIYSSIGNIYLYKGEFEKAMQNYQESLVINKKVYGDESIFTAFEIENIGFVHKEKKEYDQALDYMKKGARIKLLSSDVKNYQLSFSYFNIAEILVLQQKYDQAIKWYQKSLVSNCLTFNDTSSYEIPVIGEYLNPDQLFTSLSGKASAHKKYYKQTGNKLELETALKLFKTADSLVSELRKDQLAFDDKIELGKRKSVLYEEAIETCLLLNKVSNNSVYLELAFQFSEKSKAGTLKLAIMDIEAKKGGNLPQDIVQLESKLRADRTFYQSSLQWEVGSKEGYDTTAFDKISSSLFDTKKSYD